MTNFIFDKTDKGREEIATRHYQLPPRLRTLLVLIDGKETMANLLKKISGLGLNDSSFEELMDKGFIQEIVGQIAQPSFTESLVSSILPDDRRGTGLPAADTRSISYDHVVIREGENPLQALQMFFNETIKSALGLRGIKLLFKANRVHSLEDFRDLRNPYLEAIRAAKGEELSLRLQTRLDQLLAEAAGKTNETSEIVSDGSDPQNTN